MFFRPGRVPVKVGQMDDQAKLLPHVKISAVSDNVEDLLSSQPVALYMGIIRANAIELFARASADH